MLGFAAAKKNKERWFSESFFTHNKTYKMCLCVDTGNLEDNNDSSNDDDSSSSSHLSVSLSLMKGPHDDGLTWPLRGEFKVKLLNQVRDRPVLYFTYVTRPEKTGLIYAKYTCSYYAP